MLDTYIKPNTNTRFYVNIFHPNPQFIETRLVQLVQNAFAYQNDISKIKEIRNFVKSMYLSNEKLINILETRGFSNATAIAFKIWQQGDALSTGLAKMMLQYSPKYTWLLRYCQFQRSDVITIKEGKNNYAHYIVSNIAMEDRENLKIGYSLKYSVANMKLSIDSLEKLPINYGAITTDDAKIILNNAPIGSWILRYSESAQRNYICIKTGGDLNSIEEIIIQPDLIRRKSSLKGILNFIANTHKDKTGNKMTLVAYGKGSNQKREQLIVNYLFNLMSSQQKEDFEKEGYIKISRRLEPIYLLNSLVIKNLSQKKDEDEQTTTVYDTKIYNWVHGAEGKLGEGGVKVAKLLVNTKAELLVKCKFKDVFSDENFIRQYPEMYEIFTELIDVENVATGHLVSFEDKRTGKMRPSVMVEYATSDLKKAVDSGHIAGQPLTLGMKFEFAKDILKALAVVHAKGIAHRDLKPENINVYVDPITGQIDVKIADWDFATKKGAKRSWGTRIYMAPEICNSGKMYKSLEQLQKGDIFSTGLLLDYLFHGKHLWYDYNKPSIKQLKEFEHFIGLSSDEYAKEFPEPCDKDGIDHLIWEMRHRDPEERLPAQIILERLNKMAYS